MSEWQDIESAPRDGTPVDLWSTAGVRLTDVRWLRGAQADPERCGPGGIWEHLAMDGWRLPDQTREGCGCLAEECLSHWMPLPAPPNRPTP